MCYSSLPKSFLPLRCWKLLGPQKILRDANYSPQYFWGKLLTHDIFVEALITPSWCFAQGLKSPCGLLKNPKNPGMALPGFWEFGYLQNMGFTQVQKVQKSEKQGFLRKTPIFRGQKP